MTRRSILGRTAPAGGTWWAAAGLAIVITLHLLHALPFQDILRTLSFDVYQSIAPRQRVSAPVTIVDIDEASLQRFGQWPWPRNLMARLLDRLWAAEPAAVALDILMPEADRTSPCQITQYIPEADPKLVRSVCALPGNDQLLAAALRRGKAVVGVAGIDGEGKATVRAAPLRAIGDDPHLLMRRFDSALTNIPELQNAAAGHAVLSTDVQYGVVRKVPMVASVAGTVMPSLSLEILRLAGGMSSFVVKASGGRIEGVGIKGLFIPTQADGSLWVHYAHHDPSRFVSAVRVLDGNADPGLVHKKLVLIGLSGLGLIDFHATALGERLPGVEIHAQVLESIFDGTTLLRPYWAPWVEGLLMAIVGLLVLLGFPRLRARILVPIMSFATLLLVAAGIVAYVNGHLLLDVASPISIFVVMFGFMQADLLIRGETQRKALEADLEAQREQAARTRGEMEAARRIQMGILPDVATQFAHDPRLDVAARMQPAKQVGGDLYDCFMLDEHHAFFSIGDVCGKGVPASLFMAVSKTLCKSLALRNPGCVPDPGQLMREANREI